MSQNHTVALWFQLVLCVGVLALSMASATYTWETWRSYNLERRAEEICAILITRADENKAWFTRRVCINQAIGRTPYQP